MDYLHRQLQIIHTDVKPENVVVALPQKAVQLVMETYSQGLPQLVVSVILGKNKFRRKLDLKGNFRPLTPLTPQSFSKRYEMDLTREMSGLSWLCQGYPFQGTISIFFWAISHTNSFDLTGGWVGTSQATKLDLLWSLLLRIAK